MQIQQENIHGVPQALYTNVQELYRPIIKVVFY